MREVPFILIPDEVLQILGRHFLEGSDGARKWLDRPVPVCGGLSPLDWMRAGHTWDEVAHLLDGIGEQRG